MAHAVIMAGGQGERFWPLTRNDFPKYLIRLDGKSSLLQGTYRRLLRIYPKQNIHVVTTRDHVRFIRRELPGMKKPNILIEPLRRNTGPALFLSTAMLAKNFGCEEIISFFPADHLIRNQKRFEKTVKNAITLAGRKEVLVTIGIQPTFPATGYGYIERGSSLSAGLSAYKVKRFKEKPTRRLALVYLRKKNFLWNAGIFAWRARVFLETMEKFCPEIHCRFDLKNLGQSYKKLPKISIDYALLERAGQRAVVSTRMDWCDMGNWDMFFEKAAKDRNGNFVFGRSRHRESQGSLLLNDAQGPLVTLGLRDFIVVQTEQGTLIAKRTRSEEAALLGKGV